MGLSKDLINQFVEVTRADKPVNTETTVYGKTVEYNGKMYVQLDGSDLLTPVNTTTSLKSDERVSVMIKNHTATVTGNLSSPSATSSDIKEVSDQISEFEIIVADKVSTKELAAEKGRIDELVSDNAVIKDTLTATNAEIVNIKADNVVINKTLEANEGRFVKIEGDIANIDAVSTEDLEAINADIHNLEATYGEIERLTAGNIEAIRVLTDELAAADAAIETLESTKITTEQLDAKYANIDFANIGMAAVEKLFTESGIIKDLVVGDTSITGELVGVTIKGDIIEGNTVVADKLVVLGEDGLYYKLNTNGVTTSAQQTEYNSLNGSIITAKSITAEKVDVHDLVAFGATIGGFKIGTKSIYSGAKESINNTTRGIYMDTDGQVNFGDSSQYLKYYKTEDGTYALEVCADNIVFGSKRVSVETALNDVQSNIDNIQIGGRNMLPKTDIATYGLGTWIPYEGGNISVNTDITYNGKPTLCIKPSSKSSSGAHNSYGSKVSLVAGETYTYSCMIYSTVADTFAHNSLGHYQTTTETSGHNSAAIHQGDSIPANTWTKVRITFKPTVDCKFYSFMIYFASTDQVIYVCDLKLEKGNRATDWTPSPEDVNTDIENAVGTAMTDTNITNSTKGSPILLTDSANGSLVDFKAYGRSTQKQYTGKNLLDHTVPTQTISGVTWTRNENGSFTANGTATENSVLYLRSSSDMLKVPSSSRQLIYSGVKGGSDTTYFMQTWYSKDWVPYAVVRDGIYTTNISSEDYELIIALVVKKDVTVNNVVFEPMIRFAEITDGTYEPYVGGVPSPNPDYPQEINNVGDSGWFDGELLQGYYQHATGNFISSSNYVCSTNFIPCKENDDIKIQYGEVASFLSIIYYDSDKNYVTYKYINNVDEIEMIAPTNASYFHFNVYQTNVTPAQAKPIIVTINDKYALIVKSVNKNLLDYSRIKTTSANGATLTNNNDGSFTISGSGILSNAFNIYFDYSHEETARLLKVGELKLDINGVATTPYLYIQLRSGTNVYLQISSSDAVKTKTVTQAMLDDENVCLRVGFYGASTGVTIVGGTMKPMLYQYGDSTYEPYKETVNYIPLNEPSRGVDSASDEASLTKVTRRFAEIVYDGSDDETWNAHSVASWYVIKKPAKAVVYTNTMCSHFTNNTSLNDADYGYYIGNSNINFRNKNVTKLVDWKAWLQANPITVIYELTEPITEEIDPVEITTYNPITYITSTDDAEMDVTYYRNTENGQKVADLDSKAMGAAGNASDAANKAQSTADSATNAANKAQTDIDNLNIGGRNLFSGYGEEEITLNTYQNIGSFTQFTSNLTFNPADYVGEYFTVSFYAKSPNGTTQLQVYNSNSNPRYFYFTSVVDTALSTAWKYYTYTFLNNDRGSSYNISNKIEIYAKDKTGVLVKKIKVEKGNRATDWTPAPEDVDAGIANAQTSANNAQSSADKAQSDIDNLEIGGRNMLPKTDVATYGLGTWTSSAGGTVSVSNNVTYNGKPTLCFKPASTNTSGAGYNVHGGTVTLVAGETYTYSCMIYSTVADTFNFTSLGHFQTTTETSGHNATIKHEGDAIPANTWTKVRITFKVNADCKFLSYMYYFASSDQIIYVSDLQLEKGNRATDWTPSPADIDASIDNVADAAQSAQDTANDAQTRVVITEAAIRKLEDSISMLVRDENGASLMTQTSDGWVFNISSVTDVMNENSDLISELGNAVKSANGDIAALQGVVTKLNQTSDYVRVISYNSQPCIELGEAENTFRIRITNTDIQFVNGSNIMAYMSNDKLYIDKAEVLTEIQFGKFVWACRANGNFGLMWRGGE